MAHIVSTLTREQVDQIKGLHYHKPPPMYVIETKSKIKKSAEFKNLLDMYGRCTPDAIESGKVWYKQANSFASDLASRYRLTTEQVAAVIACLSPAAKWERNLIDAENMVHGYYHRGYIGAKSVTVTTYGKQKEKALDVLCGRLQLSMKQGLKTFNFMHNIADPDNPYYVTIDRHAWRILQGEKSAGEVKITPKQYGFAWHVYRTAAEQLGFTPCQLQAMTWVQYRNES